MHLMHCKVRFWCGRYTGRHPPLDSGLAMISFANRAQTLTQGARFMIDLPRICIPSHTFAMQGLMAIKGTEIGRFSPLAS